MKRRGSSLLEFALCLAVLAPLLAGGLQFGFSMYAVHELEDAVRRGAEYASTLDCDSPDFPRQVHNVVLYGSAFGGDKPILAGLEPGHVRVTVERDAGRPRWVEVSIVDFTLRVPGGPVALNGRPSARFPCLR